MVRDTDRREIERRISQIRKDIERERAFRRFGATFDLDYKMSNARLAGLRAELEELEELLEE